MIAITAVMVATCALASLSRAQFSVTCPTASYATTGFACTWVTPDRSQLNPLGGGTDWQVRIGVAAVDSGYTDLGDATSVTAATPLTSTYSPYQYWITLLDNDVTTSTSTVVRSQDLYAPILGEAFDTSFLNLKIRFINAGAITALPVPTLGQTTYYVQMWMDGNVAGSVRTWRAQDTIEVYNDPSLASASLDNQAAAYINEDLPILLQLDAAVVDTLTYTMTPFQSNGTGSLIFSGPSVTESLSTTGRLTVRSETIGLKTITFTGVGNSSTVHDDPETLTLDFRAQDTFAVSAEFDGDILRRLEEVEVTVTLSAPPFNGTLTLDPVIVNGSEGVVEFEDTPLTFAAGETTATFTVIGGDTAGMALINFDRSGTARFQYASPDVELVEVSSQFSKVIIAIAATAGIVGIAIAGGIIFWCVKRRNK